jgi:hypothetical protein
MKKECPIVKDLLVLYAENMVSNETKEYVKEHISHCEECNKELQEITKTVKLKVDSTMPLKSIRKKLLSEKMQIVFFTVALVLVIAVSGFALITAPKFFPYLDDIMYITENTNQTLTLIFRDDVTDFTCTEKVDLDTGIHIYQIEAWTSYFNEHIIKREKQYCLITYEKDEPISIYYLQNNDEADVLIYGTDLAPSGGVITLPKLSLNFYFLVVFICACVFVVLMFIFRKNINMMRWLTKLSVLPSSYILSHICIKGFGGTTYAFQRDFFLILLLSAIISIAAIAGIMIYGKKKAKSI